MKFSGFNLNLLIVRICFSEITCSPPKHVSHGRYVIKGASILGNVASFTCDDGYRKDGPDYRTCKADGQWSGVRPVCKGINFLCSIT